MKEIYVKTFGDLIISTDEKEISSEGSRSRKAWVALGYLICNRHKTVKKSELIELLWGHGEESMNSAGALKTLIYRVRGELERLWEGAGRDLILSDGDGYRFNWMCPITVDCEAFGEEADSVDSILEKLRLYRGDFLRNMGSEIWVLTLGAHYHNIYVSRLMQVAPMLQELGRGDEILSFWHVVSQIEPFNEDLHRIFMRAYIDANRQQDAMKIYRKLKDRLLSELGVLPGDEVRALYHEAKRINNYHTLSVENLKEQLREKDAPGGAMICEYDFFRVLYRSMARSVSRSGIAVHIALLILVDKSGNELTAKKLEKSIENLEEVIRTSLRRGDSAAKCTSSQYVIMLPSANYENSCMVCERIAKAYSRKYPGSDTMVHYEVCPIDLDEKDFRLT